MLLQEAVANDRDDEADVVVHGIPVAPVRVQHAESSMREGDFVDGGPHHALDDTEIRVWLRARKGCGELGPGGENGGPLEPGCEFGSGLGGKEVDEETQVLRAEDFGRGSLGGIFLDDGLRGRDGA